MDLTNHEEVEQASTNRKSSKTLAFVIIIFLIVVSVSLLYFFGYINLGFLHSSTALSGYHTSKASFPLAPKNNKYVYVTYVGVQTNFSNSEFYPISVTVQPSSINVTPGSNSSVTFSLTIPPQTSTSSSSNSLEYAVLKSISILNSNFTLISVRPSTPLNISSNFTKIITVSFRTPDVPYYGSLFFSLQLIPYYSSSSVTSSIYPPPSSTSLPSLNSTSPVP